MHHTVGDMPGRQLLVQLVADCAVHSWDLATAIGADPGLDEQLIELSYDFYVPLMHKDAIYAYGWSHPTQKTRDLRGLADADRGGRAYRRVRCPGRRPC